MANKGVIYADNAGIPVGVGIHIVFLQKDDDVCVCVGIERVLFSPHVVGCVVDT